jgi:hypothetical protein
LPKDGDPAAGPPGEAVTKMAMRTILLLTASNVFMTAGWYGHLRFRDAALWKTCGRLIRHARHFIVRLAESHLTQRLFGQILWRIERLGTRPDRAPRQRVQKIHIGDFG